MERVVSLWRVGIEGQRMRGRLLGMDRSENREVRADEEVKADGFSG